LNYAELSHEDFDALVTGTFTHYALWLEDVLNSIISDYFVRSHFRQDRFKRLILQREGLSFQDKIDIVRSMVTLFGNLAEQVQLKGILKEIEDFKLRRNALAHGLDASTSADPLQLRVEFVSRSGKEKSIEITPDSYDEMAANFNDLLKRAQAARNELMALRRHA
jgi:hypothetical protein